LRRNINGLRARFSLKDLRVLCSRTGRKNSRAREVAS
jgi:hypothetical protein